MTKIPGGCPPISGREIFQQEFPEISPSFDPWDDAHTWNIYGQKRSAARISVAGP
jgi:hypothetical protein